MGRGELRAWVVALLSWMALAGCYEHHQHSGSSGPDSAIVIDAGTDAPPVVEAGIDGTFMIDSAVVDAPMDSAIEDAPQDAPADATPDVFAPDGCRMPGQDVLVLGPDAVGFTGDQALEALRGYRVIEGGIVVEGITSLDALSCLERVGWFNITTAPDLRSLRGLEHLRLADGLQLDNTSVASLLPLSQMDTRQLSIRQCAQITTLDGLALTALDHLALYQLERLVDISALAGMTDVGYLELQELPALADLSPLASLRSIGGSFWLNHVGVTILSFPELVTIDGYTGIYQNQHLRLIEMPSLTVLIMRPLPPNTFGLGIQGNPLLPECVADNLRQQVGHAECECSGNTGVGMCL